MKKWAALLVRHRAARLVLLLLVTIFPIIFLASTSGPEDRIGDIIGGRAYNIVSWEVRNFFDKWFHKATSIFDGGGSQEERLSKVERYFQLNQEIATIDHQISSTVSDGTGDLAVLLVQREGIRRERDALRDEVEEIIEGQVSAVLAREGLSWKLPFLDTDGYLFPPVDFRFDDSPRVLAISPREKIELTATRLLTPSIDLEDMVEIERGVEEGVETSALVTGTGGIATYPSIVPQSTSIRDTLRLVAHEWVHHYMIFHSLGRNYWVSSDMTTVNETIADVIGDEVGDRVYDTYYTGRMADEGETSQQALSESSEDTFDFNREMRITRLKVDELLAEGEVEEAERYMEERRLFLAENGFFLRRLNQAFFAFHGTYADRPTSVSPIGGQVKEIRSESDSLKDFINTVSSVSSHDELLSLLDR